MIRAGHAIALAAILFLAGPAWANGQKRYIAAADSPTTCVTGQGKWIIKDASSATDCDNTGGGGVRASCICNATGTGLVTDNQDPDGPGGPNAGDPPVDEECYTWEDDTGAGEWQSCSGGGGEANTYSSSGGGLAVTETKTGVDLPHASFAAADFNLAASVISIDGATWASDADVAAQDHTDHGDGANCAAGEIPLGVDAEGAVQGCYEPTEADIADLSHTPDQVGTVTDGSYCQGGAGSTLDCDVAFNAGTDPTADLEEEAHASEHDGRSTTANGEALDADEETYFAEHCINIDPANSTTDWLFFRADKAITVQGIDCISAASTSTVMTVRECDANGGSCAATEAAMTCGVTNTPHSGAVDDSAIDAGDWVRVLRGTVSGTPGQTTVCVYFTYND